MMDDGRWMMVGGWRHPYRSVTVRARTASAVTRSRHHLAPPSIESQPGQPQQAKGSPVQ